MVTVFKWLNHLNSNQFSNGCYPALRQRIKPSTQRCYREEEGGQKFSTIALRNLETAPYVLALGVSYKSFDNKFQDFGA